MTELNVGDTVRLPARFGDLSKLDGTLVHDSVGGDGVDLGSYGTLYLDRAELTTPGHGTTHVLLVVDKSGSMGGLVSDVIGGYNAYLDGLAGGDYLITTTLFDTTFQSLCNGVPLACAPRLDARTYSAGGNTALLDAVAHTIQAFEAANPKLDGNDRILLVISTDGEENSSREHTWESVNALIDLRVAGGRWASVYLGAGPAAWRQSHRWSNSTQTVNTASTPRGTADSYAGLRGATVSYAAGSSTDDAVKLLRDKVGDQS
jgi:hypothetical protein